MRRRRPVGEKEMDDDEDDDDDDGDDDHRIASCKNGILVELSR